MKRFVSILAVLSFQAALIGSVCAMPKAHSCCEGMDCNTAITCCTPSPVKGVAPQTGIQSHPNFSSVVTLSFLSLSPAAMPVLAALDQTASIHSPPLFLTEQSFLL